MLKPVAVIRKVEDSPDWIDRGLVTAYLRTDYTVLSVPFPPIRVGVANALFENWLHQRDFSTCAFITARNPCSITTPLAENQRKNKELETDLQQAARCVLPGLGIGSDNKWPPEESFCAGHIRAADVVRLCLKYRQNAIVWWEKGELPALWWFECPKAG